MFEGKKIGIVGGGNMGEVLIGGIISGELVAADNVTVYDISKERLDYIKGKYGVCISEDGVKTVSGADIVILAVKPQNMKSVLKEMAEFVNDAGLFISIAAGIPIRFIEQHLKDGIRVIRVMPNTPALIGEGASALAAGENATEDDLELALRIFDSVGTTVVVKEELIDAVTGLSGSGPAYGFIIIEALSDAGVKMGLTREIALKLSAQTLLGAAKLCLKGDKTPSQLKDMVTSPGGTTIAGIKALEDGRLRATLMDAVEAATSRSRELGKSVK